MGLEAGFGPQDWDLGLEAGIWASRLRYGPGGWGRGGGTKEKKEEEKEEKEKTPHMRESIGHRPLRRRCPKVHCANLFGVSAVEIKRRIRRPIKDAAS